MSVDESQWPIAVITVENLDAQTNRRMLDACSSMLKRHERHAVVFVLNATRIPDVGSVRISAKWLEEHDDDLARYAVGVAFVIPSAVIRGSLKAIFHLKRPPMPIEVVTELGEAKAWCEARLGA
jgi:hypothetical protein